MARLRGRLCISNKPPPRFFSQPVRLLLGGAPADRNYRLSSALETKVALPLPNLTSPQTLTSLWSAAAGKKEGRKEEL